MVRDNISQWSMTEEIYPTLGIFHDGVLVSTMRIENILSEKEFEYKTHVPCNNPDISFPAMYLTKAGTWPGIKFQGLNSALRYFALQLAVVWNARFVYGIMVEGSPRVFSMQQMGYDFQTLTKKWNGNFMSEKFPMLACLDMKTNGEKALHFLKQKSENYLNDCDLQFNIETLTVKQTAEKWPWSA